MYTFFWHLKLAGFGDLDCLGRLVARPLGHIFNLVHNVVALENFAEDDMTPIEPAGHDGGNEELGAVGVLASVGHAQQTLLGVLQLEVLIGELLAVDGFPACAISSSEVASLDHEALDDSVEGGALVAKAFLAGCEGSEVLGSLEGYSLAMWKTGLEDAYLRDCLAIKTENDPA